MEKIQSSVCLTFDLDIETAWVVGKPKNAKRPTLMSLSHYAPRVGLPLILSLLERLDVKGTFFVPGKSAEDFPESVKAIIAGGHEIAVHGYTHDPPSSLTRDEEEAQLKRTIKIFQEFGVNAHGYRAPLYEISEHTLELLQKYNICYSSNLMDDIKPYKHSKTGIIELPTQWIMDDWTQFNHSTEDYPAPNATCEHVYQLWMEEFEAIHELGGIFNLVLHPQVIGRPSRVKMLERFVNKILEYEGVWIASCEAIAKSLTNTL